MAKLFYMNLTGTTLTHSHDPLRLEIIWELGYFSLILSLTTILRHLRDHLSRTKLQFQWFGGFLGCQLLIKGSVNKKTISTYGFPLSPNDWWSNPWKPNPEGCEHLSRMRSFESFWPWPKAPNAKAVMRWWTDKTPKVISCHFWISGECIELWGLNKNQLKNNWMKFLVSSCFCSFPIFSFVPTSTIFGHIQSQGYGRVLKRLRVPTTMVSHLSLAFCYRKRVEGSGLSPKSMHETFQVPKMEALTYISCM